MDIGKDFLKLVIKMQNEISLVLSATKISLILGLKPSLNQNRPKPKILVPVLDDPKLRLNPNPLIAVAFHSALQIALQLALLLRVRERSCVRRVTNRRIR